MLKRLLSLFTVVSIIGLNTIPVLAESCEKTVAVGPHEQGGPEGKEGGVARHSRQ